MYRYLAVLWNASDAEAHSAAAMIRQRVRGTQHHLGIAFEAPGLTIWRDLKPGPMDKVISLGNHAGLILGTLFDRGRRHQIEAVSARSGLDAAASDEIVRTNGRSLVEAYWGSYVLFLWNGSTERVHVLRGPMSRLPCFQAEFARVSLLFSSMEDCIALGIHTFSLNWDCIRAQAADGDYLTRETALNEVASIECGECLEFSREGAIRHTYWSPCSIARSASIDSFEEAVRTIRETTLECVESWAAGHQRILHTLSGGVDSSIVLACLRLAANAPQVSCVTFYSHDGVGDERAYARSMADKLGCALIERERNPDIDLTMFLNCARTARPVLAFSSCDSYPTSVQLSRELGATAIFDGELGDNVFGSVASHEGVVEYIWRHGITRRLISVALDFAQLRKQSVWQVLYRAIRDARRARRCTFFSAHRYAKSLSPHSVAETRLVSESALAAYEETIERFIHPWFKDIAGVPPGKLLLLYALAVVTSTTYHPPFANHGDPPLIAPLAGQPLAERALQIASNLNFQDGWDRIVAREAFASELSNLVFARSGKGGPDVWVRRIVERNRPVLRELLLDGVLVKERILDRKKLEIVLSGEVSNCRFGVADVILQLYIEAWVRQWTTLARRAAA